MVSCNSQCAMLLAAAEHLMPTHSITQSHGFTIHLITFKAQQDCIWCKWCTHHHSTGFPKAAHGANGAHTITVQAFQSLQMVHTPSQYRLSRGCTWCTHHHSTGFPKPAHGAHTITVQAFQRLHMVQMVHTPSQYRLSKGILCFKNIIWLQGTHINVTSLMSTRKALLCLCQFS